MVDARRRRPAASCRRLARLPRRCGAGAATPPPARGVRARSCCTGRTSSAATSTPARPGRRWPLIAECDRYGYAEDQAPDRTRRRSGRPTRSRWSSYALEGEAYEEPGISPERQPTPSGRSTRATSPAPPPGFAAARAATARAGVHRHRHHHRRRRTSRSCTAPRGPRRRCCGCVVLTAPVTPAPIRQELDVDDACADVDLANVDALTARASASSTPPRSVATISRPDPPRRGRSPGSPRRARRAWSATRRPPVRRRCFTAPGAAAARPRLPPDRQPFAAQALRPGRPARGAAPASVHRPAHAGAAGATTSSAEPLAVSSSRLKCGGSDVRR